MLSAIRPLMEALAIRLKSSVGIRIEQVKNSPIMAISVRSRDRFFATEDSLSFDSVFDCARPIPIKNAPATKEIKSSPR